MISREKRKISGQDIGEGYWRGVPKDKMDKIWEKYYKLDGAHRRAKIGTGLGLSIVKSIFRMH